MARRPLPRNGESGKKQVKELPMVTEGAQDLQTIDDSKQESSNIPQYESKPEGADGKIEVEMEELVSEEAQNLKSTDEDKEEEAQNMQIIDESKQESSNLPQFESKPEAADGKIEVEMEEDAQNLQSTDENKEEKAQNMQSTDENKEEKAQNMQITDEDKEEEEGILKITRWFEKKVKEPVRMRIMQQLKEFRASSNKVYIIEEKLSVIVRRFVHLLSKKMGMASKSFGKGGDRRVSVLKSKMKTWKDVHGRSYNNKSKTRKDAHALTLSEKSKDVLLNLFMQHPPGQDGLEKLKFEDSSKMKRKLWNNREDFFCKPVMNMDAIAKKVEALSLRIKNDKNLAKINEQRSRLPIASSRDVILSEIQNNQVVLISGETGCGKTTQVPQFLLDKIWESGEACKIICTQPRRISATSVAVRISQERGEVIGDTVGYKIRLESKGGRGSSLIFCTNGVLLRVLVSDGLAGSGLDSSRAVASSTLSQITHIVVDEIHERDHYSDFMLAILRDLLPRYPHLRLVLMSATMDIEKFAQYFGDCPIIRVPGFTYPVKTFYLEDVLSILESAEKNHIDVNIASSSSNHNELQDEHKVALDEAIDLAWSNDEFDALLELISSQGTSKVLNYQHSQTGISPLMVFAKKGRVGDICMLLSFGADCLLKAQDGSTALDWANRAVKNEAANVISRHLTNVSSNPKDNQELVDKYLSSVNPQFIDEILVTKLLKKICMDSEYGAILVFLPGWEDINKTRDRLLSHEYFKDRSKFLILPLHSMVPSAEQKKVFCRPPHGCRKIILSTNIAETAVTIDDVVYVIDSGRSKIKSYDPYKNVSTLQSSWVSKASAKQRAGRAGRCQPGICYHLYTSLQAVSFPEFQTPEIKRMPIEELCLQVKMLDPNYCIAEFLNKTLDPPVKETVRNAVAVLKEVGALSNDENITELGKRLGSLSVHPLTSKMLFLAILFNCLDPALTLACASDFRDPFTLPMLPEEKKKAADAKAELAAIYGGQSDQLAVVAAFECWKNASQKGLQAKFCSEYFVSSSTMSMLSMMRKQLQRELIQNGYIPNDISTCSQNARDPGLIHAVLLAGLYPKVGRVLPPTRTAKNFCVETASGDKVRVNHQSTYSLRHLTNSSDSAVVVYGEITQGDGGLQVKKCTIIGEIPLVLLASEIAVAPVKDNGGKNAKKEGMDDGGSNSQEENQKEIMDDRRLMSSADSSVIMIVDRWLSLRATALEAAQIYCLRERLSTALLLKATNPRKVILPALADSVDAIACILSYDGQSRISLTSNSADTPTVSHSKTEKPAESKENIVTDQNNAQGTYTLNHSVVPVAEKPNLCVSASIPSSISLASNPVDTPPIVSVSKAKKKKRMVQADAQGTSSLKQSAPSSLSEQPNMCVSASVPSSISLASNSIDIPTASVPKTKKKSKSKKNKGRVQADAQGTHSLNQSLSSLSELPNLCVSASIPSSNTDAQGTNSLNQSVQSISEQPNIRVSTSIPSSISLASNSIDTPTVSDAKGKKKSKKKKHMVQADAQGTPSLNQSVSLLSEQSNVCVSASIDTPTVSDSKGKMVPSLNQSVSSLSEQPNVFVSASIPSSISLASDSIDTPTVSDSKGKKKSKKKKHRVQADAQGTPSLDQSVLSLSEQTNVCVSASIPSSISLAPNCIDTFTVSDSKGKMIPSLNQSVSLLSEQPNICVSASIPSSISLASNSIDTPTANDSKCKKKSKKKKHMVQADAQGTPSLNQSVLSLSEQTNVFVSASIPSSISLAPNSIETPTVSDSIGKRIPSLNQSVLSLSEQPNVCVSASIPSSISLAPNSIDTSTVSDSKGKMIPSLNQSVSLLSEQPNVYVSASIPSTLASNSIDTPTVNDSQGKKKSKSKKKKRKIQADAQEIPSLNQSVSSLTEQPNLCVSASIPSIIPSASNSADTSNVSDSKTKSSKCKRRKVMNQADAQETHALNLSLPAAIPSSLPIQQPSLSAKSSVSQTTIHHKTEDKQPVQAHPAQACAVKAGSSSPVSLGGYGSAAYGPLGPRGPLSKKRSRSDS